MSSRPIAAVAAVQAAAALIFSAAAAANTGRIEFVSGNVSLQGANGQSRPIARGTEVSSGDTVRTNGGLVQIRYSDGAVVSLRADSEYIIEKYSFGVKPDGTESGVFKLLKGTMRTVTGLVGRVNRDKYVLTTPTATIGIRGTGGVVQVDPATGATRLFGTSGTWDLRSQTGTSVPVSAGQTGRTAANQPAESAATQPQTGTTAAAQQETEPVYTPAENRTSTGQSTATGSSSGTTSANGAVMAFVGKVGSDTVAFTDVAVTRAGSYDVKVTASGNTLSKVDLKDLSSAAHHVLTTVVSGTVAESGVAGDYTWGRMVNANVTQVYSSSSGPHTDTRLIGPNGGFYYAYGPATQDMPKTGTFTYNLMSGAQPRPSLRSEGTINATLTSGTLTGSFTAQGGGFAAQLGLSVNSQNMNLQGTGTITGNGFSVSGSASGGLCTTSCSASMQGGFAGSGAPYAAAGYMIFVPNDVLGGMAFFRKQ